MQESNLLSHKAVPSQNGNRRCRRPLPVAPAGML